MPAVDCILQHGAVVDIAMVNEPNVLVQSLTITPAREKKEYKGAGGCIEGLRFTNPTLSFDFDGFISSLAGLSDQHPGTAVVSLANYQATIHGFDNSDGVMIYEDPSRELTLEDPAKTKFKVMQYPFVN